MGTAIGVMLAFLSLIPLWVVRGSRAGGDALTPPTFWAPIGAYVGGTVVWSAWLSRRRYSPPKIRCPKGM